MLLNFTVENYKSIRGPVTFSMVAGRERFASERLIPVNRYRLRVGVAAMIQGKNGAGKSNLVKAFHDAVSFVLLTPQNRQQLPYSSFRLDDEYSNKPAKFTFEILVDSEIYRYTVAYTAHAVQYELLERIRPTKTERIFEREGQSFKLDGLSKLPRECDDLRIMAQGVRANHLFLNVLAQQAENVSSYSWASWISSIYRWFAEDVLIVRPGLSLELANEDLIHRLSAVIPLFDTGIDSIQLEKLPKDAFFNLNAMPPGLIEAIPEGRALPMPAPGAAGASLFLKKVNGEIEKYQIKTKHSSVNGDEVPFRLEDESDGTVRLLSILPFFSLLAVRSGRPKVLIIDEIDHSLHTLLTQKILTDFLQWATKQRGSQLIFTTHDVTLFQSIDFRRDELWIAHKGAKGETELLRVSKQNAQSSKDYSGVRADSNLFARYLSGQLGGVAEMSSRNFLEVAYDN